MSGGAYVFVNQYQNFIAQDLVVAMTPAGPLAQTINYARRAHPRPGVGRRTRRSSRACGVVTLIGSGAFTRGTITEGIDPRTGVVADDSPADNITPVKVVFSGRFTEPKGRWWAEYGVRTQTDVTRVARTLLESPFLIAQDLLSLDGFAVQRLAWGVNLTARPRPRWADLRAREPGEQVLPGALPVRAGARPMLHGRPECGRVLRRSRH